MFSSFYTSIPLKNLEKSMKPYVLNQIYVFADYKEPK